MIDKVKLFAAFLLIVAGIFVFYYFPEVSLPLRAGAVIVAVILAAIVSLTSEPGQQAWQFAVGMRMEVRKVVWPTRKETIQATIVVIIGVFIVGLYMWLLDTASFYVIYDFILDVRQS